MQGVKRSRKNTLIVGVLTTIGVLGWAVVVDLGVHAGKIHRGVTVGGIDVGGLTEVDAFRELSDRGELLLEKPNVFTAENVQCSFYPDELGWGPQVDSTVDNAYAVGREGGPFGSVGERLSSWVAGHEVQWAGKASARKVGTFISRCVKQAEPFGVSIDRARLRFLVKQAIVSYPETIFEIPLEGA
jgi:hypothetical protein